MYNERTRRMMMVKRETVLKYVASPKTKKESGIHAVFVKISPKWGFKYFYDPKVRDVNHEMMANLSEFGVAAKVGQCFDLDLGGETVYGFVIQVCKPIVDFILADNGFDPKLRTGSDYYNCAVEHGHYHKSYMAKHPEIVAKLALLNVRCEDARFHWSDQHAGNWGLTSDGEPVIFDVSVEADDVIYGDDEWN